MSWDTILYETHGPVARIVMNRPAKHNAESFQLVDERDAAFRRAEADPGVRVVVLAANGKSFSAGHDMVEVYGDPNMQAIRGDINTRVDFRASVLLRGLVADPAPVEADDRLGAGQLHRRRVDDGSDVRPDHCR